MIFCIRRLGSILSSVSDGRHRKYVSTVALAEYAVRDKIEHLPIRYLRVLPSNIDYVQRAGEFTAAAMKVRNQLPTEIHPVRLFQTTPKCLPNPT